MPCENCKAEFHIFRMKKMCHDCRLLYCSACLLREAGGENAQRRCKKCRVLAAGNFKRTDLMSLKARDLRHYLRQQNVATDMCREKHDLVDMILNLTSESYRRQQEEHNVMVEELVRRRRESDAGQPSSNDNVVTEDTMDVEDVSSQDETQTTDAYQATDADQSENSSTSNESNREQQKEPIKSKGKRATLTDIEKEEDLPRLTIRQLKEILACNFVDFKGCVERYELEDRVKRLWLADRENKRKLEEATANASNPTTDSGTARKEVDDNLCKICMDATIDCVLLECGHMVTCTRCGKVMSECPICRQYVVRAVHIFRA